MPSTGTAKSSGGAGPAPVPLPEAWPQERQEGGDVRGASARGWGARGDRFQDAAESTIDSLRGPSRPSATR